MLEVLNDARESYDVVIVDSPPVLATADVEGIASHGGVRILSLSITTAAVSVLRAINGSTSSRLTSPGSCSIRDGQPEAYGY